MIGIGGLSGAAGDSTPPANPKNVIFSIGQSNADTFPSSSVEALMTAAGISNPAYYECPFPGRPFRDWYISTGWGPVSDGSETPESVTALSQSGGTATGTSTLTNKIATSAWVVISGADQSEYNGLKRVTSQVGSDFTFDIDSAAVSPATGTITVRRAGFQEKFIADMQALTNANVIGFLFNQGEGNSTNAAGVVNEYIYFKEFVTKTYEWLRGTLTSQGNCTVDKDFVFSIALTSLIPPTLVTPTTYYEPASQVVRDRQIRACDRRDWAYWTETLGMTKVSDGVHFENEALEVKTAQIQSILNKQNYYQVTT
jgi:hypothetical protein